MVYLSHRDCWKVAFSSAPLSSPLDWSRLAVQTRPFETRDSGTDRQPVVCHEDLPTPLPASVASDSSLFYASTTLAKLLSKVRALPPELQLQIMSSLKDTMFASLLQAMTFVSEVLPHLPPRSPWTIQPKRTSLQVSVDENIQSLFGCSRSIMGRPYLSELALGPLNGSTTQIPLANRSVRGLQFALGRFGLRGVRISYQDGSFSSWLGDSSFCWLGTVLCSELSKLNVIADVSDPCMPIQQFYTFYRKRKQARTWTHQYLHDMCIAIADSLC